MAPLAAQQQATLERVLVAAKAALGADKVIEMPQPSMGSEESPVRRARAGGAPAHRASKIDGLRHHDSIAATTTATTAIPVGVRVVTRAHWSSRLLDMRRRRAPPAGATPCLAASAKSFPAVA